ncbi:MAG: hypothetical protein RL199_251 [Pseudomonadota bacterium]|jgi:hypothetical protein
MLRKLLFSALVSACATAGENVRPAAPAVPPAPFPADAPLNPLADHCSEEFQGGTCADIRKVREALDGAVRLHRAQMDAWLAATKQVSSALSAGFTDPAIALEMAKEPLPWSDPEQSAVFPVTARVQSDSGLTRSRNREALTVALKKLANLSNEQNKAWTALVSALPSRVRLPESIAAERTPFSLELSWGGLSVTALLPESAAAELDGAVPVRNAFVSLVISESDLKYRDVSSVVLPLEPAFAWSRKERSASLVESRGGNVRTEVGGLSAPVDLTCQGLRVELRFVDGDTLPARSYAVRTRTGKAMP